MKNERLTIKEFRRKVLNHIKELYNVEITTISNNDVDRYARLNKYKRIRIQKDKIQQYYYIKDNDELI